MEKKRTLGIKVSLLVLLYLLGIVVSWIINDISKFPGHSLLVKYDTKSIELQNMFLGYLVFLMLQFSFLTATIIGIFNLKRWGYFMFWVCSLGTIYRSGSYIFPLLGRQELLDISRHYPLVQEVIIIVCFIGVSIYFLLPHVKSLFLTVDEQDKARVNLWSDLLLILCLFLIYTADMKMSFHISRDGFILALKSFAFGWAYDLIYIILAILLLNKRENFRKIFIAVCCYSIFIEVIKMPNPFALVENLVFSVTYIIILTRPQMKKIFINSQTSSE